MTRPILAGAARRPTRGFTMVELMVTLAITAVLTVIAVGAYGRQIRQSRRTEAKTAILDLAGREERNFSTNNLYTTYQGPLGLSSAATTATSAYPVGSGYYTVTITCTNSTVSNGCTAASAAPIYTYTITATAATTDQLKDTACKTFTVTQTGLPTAQSSTGADNTAYCLR